MRDCRGMGICNGAGADVSLELMLMLEMERFFLNEEDEGSNLKIYRNSFAMEMSEYRRPSRMEMEMEMEMDFHGDRNSFENHDDTDMIEDESFVNAFS